MTIAWLPFWFAFAVAVAYRIGHARGRALGWKQCVEALKKEYHVNAFGVKP